MVVLILFIIAYLYFEFDVKFDYTRDEKLLLWYTQNSNRNYWILWQKK